MSIVFMVRFGKVVKLLGLMRSVRNVAGGANGMCERSATNGVGWTRRTVGMG